ncbi:MAG: 3-oxoacyl-[acyl-carrier-protein] synthase III C-terminal domain-containing protein [Desulfomonilia bacterium]|nr:3-oxoacyl-[acyl-carrier-protein] synthase III C-terminal domain-containing protein [Desulfomonilia bacterium]
MIGITSYGAYIPRLRLSRKIIAQNMAWYAPEILAASKGERSVANWDEDALSMAVAASYDCLTGRDKKAVDAIYLASTTLPFVDRLNADVLATAVNTREERVTCADFTGSLKSGTTALMAAADALKGGKSSVLVAASEMRRTKAATTVEMYYGDGAAALHLGTDGVIAELTGTYSLNCDFVDHYRGAGKDIDYRWEERWVRDEGYGKIIPKAIAEFVAAAGVKISEYSKVIYPCYFGATHAGIAKRLGLAPEQVQDPMHAVCGDTGSAHALLMLIAALEEAKPGDKLLLASFGQGSDVLSFQVTEQISSLKKPLGVRGSLANRVEMTNYQKFIKFKDLIISDMGIRGEPNPNTSLTTLWRNRKKFLGLVGTRCTKCGTPQYSFTPVCVNPECKAAHQMEEYEFADKLGRVLMYTGDMLAPSVDPPAVYGIVSFDDGGRLLADFTDCDLNAITVGLPVQMSFRRRRKDEVRGFSVYFWKAVPQVQG